MKRRFFQLLRSLSAFSDREGRRVLLLIPLLLALSLLFRWQGRPRFERSFTMLADRMVDSAGTAGRRHKAVRTEDGQPGMHAPGSLFAFDPNTVTQPELERLGFTSKQAAAILHYRTAGAVFRRAEDFARCYTVSDQMFRRLSPYIKVVPHAELRQFVRQRPDRESDHPLPQPGGPEPRVPDESFPAATGQRRAQTAPRDTLFAFDPNAVTQPELERLGFTPKQAAAILRYRAAGAVFRRPEDFARCYTVSEEKFVQLEPYIRIAETYRQTRPSPQRDRAAMQQSPQERSAPLDLNSADSASLVALRGIGPLTAGRIVAYRERLGGFAGPGQLAEVEGMTEGNYREILQQIWVDSSKIRKIDINFALPLRMKGHPYLGDKVLNRILKFRQLKGGWRSIADLTEQRILTGEQAERLKPYLCFRTK